MLSKDLDELILLGRSIREYDEKKPVTEDILKALVNGARLSPSAGNRQPLKYKLTTEKNETEAVLALTQWAAYIKDRRLPPDGKHPTGFITICHDTDVCPRSEFSTVDVGIAAEIINLGAVDKGFGCCMIGSFDKEKISALLSLPDNCEPVLIVAVGAPAESPVLCSPNDGDIKYFRDDANLHFVPKRPFEEIIL